MIFKYIVPFLVLRCFDLLIFSKNFRTNLLFQFCPIRAKTQTGFLSHERCDITIFPFKNFPPFQPRSCISNPLQFHDREIDLTRSRVSFRFIVIPLLFPLCSNCVWVRIGNRRFGARDRLIERMETAARLPVHRFDFRVAVDGRHVRSRVDHFPATVPM